MYEVINITTTTETYIANGLLTHNKIACPGTTLTGIAQTLYCAFESNYQPAYPFFITTNITYQSDTSCGSATISPTSRTVNSSPYTGYFSIPVTITPTVAGGTNLRYTASAYITDTNGKVANNNGNQLKGKVTYCLTPDTLIELYDGDQVELKDVKVGDELLTVDRESMQYEKTVITHKDTYTVEELYLINDGILRCSDGHQHIIKRESEWLVVGSYNLVVGDIMLSRNFEEVLINKIDILK